ncbi:DUF2252 family protein [Arthrobacter sp. AL12]|uniref:DUF2252 family protein n=1 Tax=Arthrobacter sp. AL12 TaxID=3042241 RepID=UPI00249CCEB1|nr:DUF2252 family protein [Arthrobacter sp. AL12]MDI3211024.1 DUF2252 family protein [Arthrobacter sp. AL12]
MKTAQGQEHKNLIARARSAGREARNSLPRKDFAALTLPERDPVGILEGQHATRLADLIPVRVGRMLETPFSFYRGAAAVMAHDLAESPVTGHTLCWIKDVKGDDGRKRDFYIGQFRDMKGSFTLAEMNDQETSDYGSLCGAYSHGPTRKAPAAPSFTGIWAAAKPSTMRWQIEPEALRTKRKPTMPRWNKRSNRGGCPLNAACSVWEEWP